MKLVNQNLDYNLEKIAFIHEVIKKESKLVEEINKAIEGVDKTLAKLHVELNGIGYIKTHMNEKEWLKSEQGTLKLNFKVKATDKFKFIKNRGYDSRGAGANQATLNNKAERMENKLQEAHPEFNFNVNQFSLEEGSTPIIEAWFKVNS